MAGPTRDDPPPIVCLAGFGDDARMYAPLVEAARGSTVRPLPIDLPGFGAPALGVTSLDGLADHVALACERTGARTIVAHSVASIVATLAAERSAGRVRAIVSLEGNLTAADAYFSGTAADHPAPDVFRQMFLARLDALATDDPVVAGYRSRVVGADPRALWELGREARAFSEREHPGERLAGAADTVVYVHESANCAEALMAWRRRSALIPVHLVGVAHWPTVDRPGERARILNEVLVVT